MRRTNVNRAAALRRTLGREADAGLVVTIKPRQVVAEPLDREGVAFGGDTAKRARPFGRAPSWSALRSQAVLGVRR